MALSTPQSEYFTNVNLHLNDIIQRKMYARSGVFLLSSFVRKSASISDRASHPSRCLFTHQPTDRGINWMIPGALRSCYNWLYTKNHHSFDSSWQSRQSWYPCRPRIVASSPLSSCLHKFVSQTDSLRRNTCGIHKSNLSLAGRKMTCFFFVSLVLLSLTLLHKFVCDDVR